MDGLRLTHIYVHLSCLPWLHGISGPVECVAYLCTCNIHVYNMHTHGHVLHTYSHKYIHAL